MFKLNKRYFSIHGAPDVGWSYRIYERTIPTEGYNKGKEAVGTTPGVNEASFVVTLDGLILVISGDLDL